MRGWVLFVLRCSALAVSVQVVKCELLVKILS